MPDVRVGAVTGSAATVRKFAPQASPKGLITGATESTDCDESAISVALRQPRGYDWG